MSKDVPISQEERLFKIALDTRNFEISLFWQRSNYFLVLNTALAVGFFSVDKGSRGQDFAPMIAVLGMIASTLWLLVNSGSKYWQSRWEHELMMREHDLDLKDPIFAADRELTDAYVRQSLRRYPHGRLQRLTDNLVLRKPSVSFMMTILSIVFLCAWAFLLIQHYQLSFNLKWGGFAVMTLPEFALSVLSSLAAIALLYLLYGVSGWYAKRHIATAECWWLPGAATFRFVIRNIPRKANLSDIRYKVWLRAVERAREGLSVETYNDIELAKGERLLLPGNQDLPLICFRMDIVEQRFNFVVTDKMGKVTQGYWIDEDDVSLMVEFSVRARTWYLFKHEISRLYSIPRLPGDLFSEQSETESELTSVMQYTDEVTVTI